MKHLLLVISLLFYVASFAQSNTGSTADINWISLEEAEKKMQKEPRKVIIDVYTDWCGPCKMMNNTTFKDPQVVKYINDHYYAIKFNAEGGDPVTFRGQQYVNSQYDPARAQGRNGTHDLTKAIAPVQGRIAYPTIVYMNEEFEILSPVQGMYRADQIMPILTFFGDDIYQTKTWEQYTQGSN